MSESEIDRERGKEKKVVEKKQSIDKTGRRTKGFKEGWGDWGEEKI